MLLFYKLFNVVTKRPQLCYLLLLGAVCLVFFGGVLTHGYVLDGNWDRRDHVYPFHLVAREALQSGTWPQWNPYIFCGSSFLFSTINLSFYPLMWPVYALPENLLPVGTTIVVALHFFMAGWFAFLLIRELFHNNVTAATFSLAFVLSSSMVMNMAGESAYFGLSLLPLMLWLLVTHGKRRFILNVALLAACYGLLMVSGIANVVLYVAALCLVYPLYVLAVSERTHQAMLLLAANVSAFLLGVGLAAVRLLPFFYDSAYYMSAKATYDSFLETGWTPYEALLRLFMPHFFGDKTYPTTINLLIKEWLGRDVLGVMNNFEAFCVYTGIPAAFLALYAVCFVWTRNSGYWKLAFIGTVLTVCGGPLAYVHFVLTQSSNVHFVRLSWLFPLYVAVLAAQGWVQVRQTHAELRKFTIFTVACAGIVYLLSVLVGSRIEWMAGINEGTWPYHASAQWYFCSFTTLFVILLVVAQVGFKVMSRRHVDLILLVLVVGDLLITSRVDKNFSRPFLSPVDRFVVSEVRHFLPQEVTESKLYRVLSVDPETQGCKTIHLSAYNMSGLDQSAPRFITELYWYPAVPNRMEARSVSPANQQTFERVLQLTSTSLVLTPDGALQVPNALPRWSLLSDYRVIKDPKMQKSEVLSAAFDPHRSVILEKTPGLPMVSEPVNGEVSVIGETANDIAFEVETRNNAIFLLTNTFYPGWTATVNGQPAEIIKANAAFQSISVPAGHSTVRFSFRHERWNMGVAISLLSICIVGGLLVVALAGRSRGNLGVANRLLHT
jgi:hypothetical protein